MLLQSILKTTWVLIFQIFINIDSVSMKKLKQIVDDLGFDARQNYLDLHFPNHNKGSSRIVIPVSEKYVLKIAYNEFGIEQNKNEFDIITTIPIYYRRFFAKIKQRSDNFNWILQERVRISHSSKLCDAQTQLVNMLCEEYDLCLGDLYQVGYLKNRLVFYDYGYTEKLANQY